MDSLVASPIPKSRGGANDDSFIQHNHHTSPTRVGGGTTAGNAAGAVSSVTLLDTLRGEKEEQARWRAVREAYQEPELQEVPLWLAALHAKKRVPTTTDTDAKSTSQSTNTTASLDTRSLMEVLADSISDGHRSIATPDVPPILTSTTAAWMRSMSLQKSQRREVEEDEEGRSEKPFNSEWLRLISNPTTSNV